MQWQLPPVLRSLDLSILKKSCLALALFVFLLIPLDALIVYFSPSSSSRAETGGTVAFAGLAMPELGGLTAYQDAVRSSRVFGASPHLNPQAAVSAQASDLRLKGIVELAGRDAILENVKSKRTLFLKQGDRVEGYAVKEVGGDFIVLSDGNNDIRLKIEGST